jgi:hypothetical protein
VRAVIPYALSFPAISGVMDPKPRVVLLLLLTWLTACDYRPGCGYSAADRDLMSRVIAETRREGIKFEVLNDGSLRCESESSERFNALVATVERQWEQEWQAEARAETYARAGEVGVRIDRPKGTACLSKVLADQQVPFETRVIDGAETVYWHPVSPQHKSEVISAAYKCIEHRESDASPEQSPERKP